MESKRQSIVRVLLWQVINLMVNVVVVLAITRRVSFTVPIVLTNLAVKPVLQYGYARFFQKYTGKNPLTNSGFCGIMRK